jgi:hypothetical protein
LHEEELSTLFKFSVIFVLAQNCCYWYYFQAISYLYSTCIDSTWTITNEHGSGHRRGGVDWPVGCTWPEKGMQVEDVSQN